MTSPLPSTPSEGEIVESDSEKATTSLLSVNGTNVDRKSRKTLSISRSPSPIRSPTRRKSHTRSRSPYRESRGAKRLREDDHYGDRTRGDPRHSKVRYKDRSHGIEKDARNRQNNPDRSEWSDLRIRYDDRVDKGLYRGKRPRTRSRSPVRLKTEGPDFARNLRKDRSGRTDDRGWRGRGDLGYRGSSGRLSTEQSVSDRGQSPVAAAIMKQKAETRINQTERVDVSKLTSGHVTDEIVAEMEKDRELKVAGNLQPVDEAMLIEDRRKRREAIKAKYKGQTTPMLVEALALDNISTPTTPKLTTPERESVVQASLQDSPSIPPKTVPGQDSSTAFVVLGDTDLLKSGVVASAAAQGDEPSSADYDPMMDMQEDKMRHDQRHHPDDIPSGVYDENVGIHQNILVFDRIVERPVANDTNNEFDMFADEDEIDMFAEAPTAGGPNRSQTEAAKVVPALQAKALDMSMLDDWDDQEGYYKVILGELLDGRYHIQSNLGKGMFSGVVRATDQRTKRLVAIKLIRNNESMKKAGIKEIEILQKLSQSDPEDKKHMIRLERFFEHKGHLCMVFENLSINLREVLKKFGRDVGINLKAVRAYAQQMFMGLSLLRKCNILHADLKPDNVLVNESRNLLKICDLGSASDASENEITPYLVSRFYRAPEIILGIPYDFGIDIWSIGCTLFELYTGKILFTGRSNNQMLRAIMECRGKFSHKILRKAHFAGLHFDDLLNFRSVEKDRLASKDVVRILNFTKPTRDLKTRLFANTKGMDDVEIKELNLFVDLLERCLNLNPDKRCSPAEALKHPFILRTKP